MSDQDDFFAGVPPARRQVAMPGTFVLGQIAGIQVGVNYTWLIAFALITFSLAAGFFPIVAPGLSPAAYWVSGAAGAILLFVSVLIHELSHSLVAKARGLPVSSITLFIFGGVSNLSEEPRDPGQELLIAIVGPLASLALAGVFFGLSALVGTTTTAVGALLFYLALANLLLALFNLLPGFPLDGGRVLRAIIWAITGSLRQATNWASGVGQVFAFILILWGIFQIFTGNFLGGIWIAFIGWFLNGAAESSRRQVDIGEALRGIRVRDVMTPQPAVVPPTLPVRAFVDDYALRRGIRAVLVAADGHLAGIATLTDVHKLPSGQWDDATVGEIMTKAPLVATAPGADLQAALRLMSERDFNQLPVMEDGQLVGMLTRSNVIRLLHFRDELGSLPSPIDEDEHQRAA